MSDLTTREIDLVIEDLERALRRCDEAEIGTAAAPHVDLALHFALLERDQVRATS